MPSIDLSPVDIPPPTKLQEIRTSPLREFGPVLSGIDKQLQNGSLHVAKLGLPDDEHDLTFHGGIDKAVHQYCANNYSFWQGLFPDEPIRSRFVPGGFGENLVAVGFDETNICIGDLVRIGPPGSSLTGGSNGCVLEVSLPRQPCFKLNQRFGIKNFAPKTHQQSKTGWYYRVKEEGVIEAGMEMRIMKRDHPRWTIFRLHHYVHRDRTDMDITKELMDISVIGNECRDVFKERWEKHIAKTSAKKGSERPFRLAKKTMETLRIVRLELEAIEKSADPEGISFGSFAVIKLPNGLSRAYSVVNGNIDSFVLGVARDDNSRGGSVYIHDELEEGSTIMVKDITQSVRFNGMASHLIFIVGGIGITAFLDMMARVLRVNQTLELHYAVRTENDVAFKPLLSVLGSRVKVYDRSKGERMNIEEILRNRIWNSHVLTCGPQRMIDGVVAAAAAAGMSEDEVYYEVFTSADTTGDPFSVKVVGDAKNIELNVGSDNTLLEALREAGLEVSSSCETGNCGTCRVAVKCGRIDHRGTGLTKEEQKNEMLSCVSRGIGHIEIELTEL